MLILHLDHPGEGVRTLEQPVDFTSHVRIFYGRQRCLSASLVDFELLGFFPGRRHGYLIGGSFCFSCFLCTGHVRYPSEGEQEELRRVLYTESLPMPCYINPDSNPKAGTEHNELGFLARQ